MHKIGRIWFLVTNVTPRGFHKWAFTFKATGDKYVGFEFFGILVSVVVK